MTQVSEILQAKGEKVVSILPGESISEVANTLRHERVGAALVRGEDGKMLGIISERDVVNGIAQHGPESLRMAASDMMTASLITCSPETDTEELMEKMLTSRIRHLPVVSDETLVGIVSIGDLVKAVVQELRWMRSTLQDQLLKSAAWSTEEDLE